MGMFRLYEQPGVELYTNRLSLEHAKIRDKNILKELYAEFVIQQN